MELHELNFTRKFSLNLYKNLTLRLGEMSFHKDFVHTHRGDPYPILEESTAEETIANDRWLVEGRVCRLLGQYFPYATYDMTIDRLEGKAAFLFRSPSAQTEIGLICLAGVLSMVGNGEEIPLDEPFVPGMRLLVTARGGEFDLYTDTGRGIVWQKTFRCDGLADTKKRSVFLRTAAAVSLEGSAELSAVSFYLDCGISQADIRPIRYENGQVMVENGRIYLTMSIRMQAQTYQGIFSWIPGTAEFALTGALFFDAGDDVWNADVASSILYHRAEQRWYIWGCAFSQGHILGHAVAEGDVRFGVNVFDITTMEKMSADTPSDAFLGRQHDEDPDFFYDEQDGLWKMAICRIAGKDYQYHFYESSQPFTGYRPVGHTTVPGAETGGSFVRLEGKLYFVCGNDYRLRANYRVYRWGDFDHPETLRCDYDDGGFRGWGTVIPVRLGTRTRIFWLTFDRHNGSDYNWSYGNLYGFEAEEYWRNI